MARKEVVTLQCDHCGAEELVSTHTLHVDGHGIEFEACESCWQNVVLATFGGLSKVGREIKVKKVTQRKNVWQWPGSEWDFTSHSLLRMAERHVMPVDVIEAAENPTMTRPAREPGLEIRTRHGVKAVVNPERMIVVTVAKRDEEVEDIA